MNGETDRRAEKCSAAARQKAAEANWQQKYSTMLKSLK